MYTHGDSGNNQSGLKEYNMNTNMKCPICNDGKIITYIDGTYECDNPECSIYNGTHTETFEALICTKKQLVTKCNRLENLMKAIDLSIEAINKGCDALIGCQEADDKYISDVTAEDGLELLSEYLGKIRFLQKEAKDGKLGN